MTPQLLIAGHIVKDVTPEGWHPGGGALYAAAQAARLGVDTAVVTACDNAIRPHELLPDVEWHVKRVDEAIRFKNSYDSGERTQHLLSIAAPITLEDIPTSWLTTPCALLAPVFHDVSVEVPDALVKQGTTVGLGAQGWLRTLDEQRVRPGVVESAPPWLTGDVVFVSEEDVDDREAVAQWQRRVSVVVLTRGRRGCTIWDATGRHELAAAAGREVDPTGAGDCFATAFLVRYHETRDALASAGFAATAAAIAIEGHGTDAIGTREQIEARLHVAGVR